MALLLAMGVCGDKVSYQTSFKIPYIYFSNTKLYRQQAKLTSEPIKYSVEM
jgi:hypothetical protein